MKNNIYKMFFVLVVFWIICVTVSMAFTNLKNDFFEEGNQANLIDESLNETSAIEDNAISTIGFNDIKGHWAEYWIEQINLANIINGYPDGTFRPEEQVTVGEYVKMISMIMYGEYDYKKPVEGEHWALQYVKLMQHKYIVPFEEYETSEELDKIITRNEMTRLSAKMLLKINSSNEKIKIDEDAGEKDLFLDTTQLNPEDKMYINILVKYGVINGFEDATFKPSDGLTRGQAAKVIYLVKYFK